MHSPEWGKRTAVQIVFGTLSTCYFISQMENNNTDSGVGTAAAPQSAGALPQLAPSEFAPLFLNMQSDFGKRFWRAGLGGLTNTDDDKWQSAGLAVNRLLREIIQNINVNAKKKKKKNLKQKRLDAGQTGWGFLINSPTAAVAHPKLNECVRSWMIYTFGLI